MARTTSRTLRSTRQALQNRLSLLAMENISKRNNASVRRLLEQLSEENLTELAAAARAAQITIECGFLDKVWDDTRVANRIAQLARQGVTVERETVATRFGDAELARERLVLKF